MRNRRLIYSLAGLAVAGLIVLLLMLPKQPASVRNRAEGAPTDPDSLRLLQAINLVNSENPMQGIQMLQSIVAEDSTNLQAQYYLGLFSVRSGQLDRAMKRFKTVTEIDPTFAPAYAEMGSVYLEIDSVENALECFSECLEHQPDNLDALFFTARIYEQKGEFELARRYYNQVLELNTDTLIETKVLELVHELDKKFKP